MACLKKPRILWLHPERLKIVGGGLFTVSSGGLIIALLVLSFVQPASCKLKHVVAPPSTVDWLSTDTYKWIVLVLATVVTGMLLFMFRNQLTITHFLLLVIIILIIWAPTVKGQPVGNFYLINEEFINLNNPFINPVLTGDLEPDYSFCECLDTNPMTYYCSGSCTESALLGSSVMVLYEQELTKLSLIDEIEVCSDLRCNFNTPDFGACSVGMICIVDEENFGKWSHGCIFGATQFTRYSLHVRTEYSTVINRNKSISYKGFPSNTVVSATMSVDRCPFGHFIFDGQFVCLDQNSNVPFPFITGELNEQRLRSIKFPIPKYKSCVHQIVDKIYTAPFVDDCIFTAVFTNTTCNTISINQCDTGQYTVLSTNEVRIVFDSTCMFNGGMQKVMLVTSTSPILNLDCTISFPLGTGFNPECGTEFIDVNISDNLPKSIMDRGMKELLPLIIVGILPIIYYLVYIAKMLFDKFGTKLRTY
jgi:hypothetical protein